MIRAVLVKDLLLLTRGTSFRVVLVGYLAVFVMLSLLFYSEFAAAEGGASSQVKQAFSKRVLVSQAVLLTTLTPWVVLRFMLRHRGDNLVRLIALTFLTPWKVVIGKLMAASMYLCQLLFLSLPVMTMTYLLGAATVRDILWSYVDLFVWLALVQLSTFGWSVRVANALLCLVFSYLTLLVLSAGHYYLVTSLGEVTRVLTVVGLNVCLGLLLLRYCNKNLIYLRA